MEYLKYVKKNRDYLKTCAKVLKAIINHGGDSKYKKNENNDDEYFEEA